MPGSSHGGLCACVFPNIGSIVCIFLRGLSWLAHLPVQSAATAVEHSSPRKCEWLELRGPRNGIQIRSVRLQIGLPLGVIVFA
eukprot:6451067-Alexandrium_andersonii.AAC.1